MKQRRSVASPQSIATAQSAHLEEQADFECLLDCLNYALAIDDTVNLARVLGMSAALSNQEALAHWVRNETQGIPFPDTSALFTFLVNQLEKLIDVVRRKS